MNAQFWRDRRVFLTGHTGFKGSWLSVWLQMLGAKVTGFALPPSTDPSLFELALVGSGMTSIFGDVRSREALVDAIVKAEPEIIIHMAAQPLVRASYADPVGTYATNVMGTVHLLDAARATGTCRAIVNVTTDKCYQNNEWEWGYREVDRLGGRDPYSNSKACSELVTEAFGASFFDPGRYEEHSTALATARAGNVIGGGDYSPDRLVPDLVAAFRQGVPAAIRHPNATRPWQHVLEPLRGYLMLAEHLYEEGPTWSGAWNFGPIDNDARSVGWVADQLASRWGLQASWRLAEDASLHEATNLKLDISKAQTKLKWVPVLDASEALGLVARWEKAREAQADMRSVTEQQIVDYARDCCS